MRKLRPGRAAGPALLPQRAAVVLGVGRRSDVMGTLPWAPLQEEPRGARLGSGSIHILLTPEGRSPLWEPTAPFREHGPRAGAGNPACTGRCWACGRAPPPLPRLHSQSGSRESQYVREKMGSDPRGTERLPGGPRTTHMELETETSELLRSSGRGLQEPLGGVLGGSGCTVLPARGALPTDSEPCR